MTFTSVLIANRGEIAVRVIRACREAGLRSIAVYSDADKHAPHVLLADEAVRLGPTPAGESYLNIDRVLEAAKATGAESIHPGYGFLSERAEFARAVVDAGLVFIGPGAEVMESMGRKDKARTIAERAGVPVNPRYDEDAVPADAYPVLVKAAAGGGGKGMRVVRAASDLAAAIAAARREAASAFGDDTLLIERYVENGRHVEVQVIADNHGNVVHLFTRDCSVQRRHQKVIEEAPAPDLSDAVRATLHDSSVALSREVGYTNAGTVEFLVSGSDVFFLEMNTRLQVEHPVTEEITGIDLVQWQFAVAAGEPLPILQQDIRAEGHAMEVRVYAEDPYSGFLPQAGRAHEVFWPHSGARVEEAFERGQEVSTAYDPMLAKIIVHGDDREDARARLIDALDNTGVFGITTNTGFLRRLVASEEFARGDIHTGWLDSDASAEFTTATVFPEAGAREAARLWARIAATPDEDPFGAGDSWRAGADPAKVIVQLVDAAGTHHDFRFDREEYEETGDLIVVDRSGVSIAWEGQPWRLNVPDPMRSTGNVAGEADVVSPMPGTVLEVTVAEGDQVTEGQTLGMVEAMKMELALKAPYDGVVSQVGAVVGAQVPLGFVLFTVDPQ